MENSSLITKALCYIKSEIGKSNITVDEIATNSGFSTDYFNRIFFAHTGFHIMEYVRFTRLKKASRILRETNLDIIDIAMDCGYDAPDSFSRAFKNQYGVSPIEYRKKHKNEQAYYGEFHNDTIGARLLHEFKNFKIANSDEVIEYLLEKDAVRYGYIAVSFRVNGGVALYNSDDFRGGFVWFTEWDSRIEGEIICDDPNKIAEYKSIFSDERFILTVYATDDAVKDVLLQHSVTHRQINVYIKEPYTLSPLGDISMRDIRYDDIALVEKLCFEIHSPRVECIKRELYRRDVLKNPDNSIFIFGIFKGENLIGISEGGLQHTHGFSINNCVVTTILPKYESEELYRYAFKFVTNAALEKGALPIDDIQTPDTSTQNRSGIFNSTDLGYKNVINAYILK